MIAPSQENWILISFYTEGTGYEREAFRLRRSLEALNIKHKIYPVPPSGTWRKNLQWKSRLILQAFDEFPDKDIVFVDADAVVHKYPGMFDKLSTRPHQFDLAAHYFRWRESAQQELLSGTLWVANNATGRRLMGLWHEFSATNLQMRHQECLRVILDKGLLGVAVYRLPFEYTAIFDAPQRKGIDPVIEHFQASRRLRNAHPSAPKPEPIRLSDLKGR
jgi:hypothetical protein